MPRGQRAVVAEGGCNYGVAVVVGVAVVCASVNGVAVGAAVDGASVSGATIVAVVGASVNAMAVVCAAVVCGPERIRSACNRRIKIFVGAAHWGSGGRQR